jgi:urate oxidase
MSDFKLEATYGKQSVPVFKIRKQGAKHEVIDMMVKIMLKGDVSDSWLTGENYQILPTETQKNTCYAIALKTTFDSIENYGINLAKDILARHKHINTVSIEIKERTWKAVTVKGKEHNHVFTSAADPIKRSCEVVMNRGSEGSPAVTSGVCDVKVMKTSESGFAGYIVDEYTNLQPVGSAASSKHRVMCTLMESSWKYARTPAAGFSSTNAAVFDTLLGMSHLTYITSI